MVRRPSLVPLVVSVVVWLVGALAACQIHRPTVEGPVPSSWAYPLDAAAVTAPHAMVVSDSALATHVGAQVLARGGNAVDAAVATAFALAVTLPEAGNLGGGGFALVRTADGQTYALDFREMAPAKATRDMYLDANGKPTDESLAGPRASGVPGSVAGYWALHQRLGSKPWPELLAPAIQLAEAGFPVNARMANGIKENQDRLAKSPASAKIFLPGGAPPAIDSTFKQPELATTLRRIADNGAAGFYDGPTAELIAEAMARTGGLITAADLTAYQAKWRTPIETQYRGYQILGVPLPSSGGTVVAQIAGILEGWELKQMGWHSADHLTLLAEAEQRAFADRNEYLGDPDFVATHPDLLADTYIAKRRATIDLRHATPSTKVRPGLSEGEHTTHFNVVDAKGGAVALTTTLNALYGSGVTIDGAGFLMNDEMDDFAVKPGTPNLFGLVQSENNKIEPGKRPLSSVSPTVVLDREGKVVFVGGGRGGSRIISATFQVMSNVLDFGMSVAPAVAAPRVHHQDLPDVLFLEPDGFRDEILKSLTARGFTLKSRGVIANSPAIVRAKDGAWSAYADPRRGGGAEGN